MGIEDQIMSKKYIVSGSAIIDNVIPFDKTQPHVIRPGGGAPFALTGIRLWDDDAALVVYTGKDFETYYGEWLSKNNIDYSGIVKFTEHTRVIDLIYNEEGTFSFVDMYPDEYANNSDKVTRALLEPCIDSSTKGIHILGKGEPDTIADMYSMCREKGIKFGVEYEIFTLFGRDDNVELFRELASYTDYYSLSHYECKNLFKGIRDVNDSIELLESFEKPCFLRAGTDGAYFLIDGQKNFSPLISEFGDVDPTGCGNSSTSAAFWAMCEGYSPLEASYIGAITASVNAGTEGIIQDLTPELRAKCFDILRKHI